MHSGSGRITARRGRALAGILALLISAGAQAQDNVNNLHLFGTLVAEPCTLPPGAEDIPLNFGSVINKYLYTHGRSASQAFHIQLADCDLTLGKTVSVRFYGTESAALPGLLAIDSTSGTQGIAIGLEAEDASPLPINQAGSKVTLSQGSNQITVKAYVRGEADAIATQSIQPGPFSATATFSLEYE
ncbi:fimbrial protein [Pantoea sp. 1.19]|uniref:fimbrial protein n=1 Tax=Pantoea sp. 1.19 TaxID=1925589 RepID=UPI00094910A4|nr:fimbrial protein [Pantoea sp. 1.19]